MNKMTPSSKPKPHAGRFAYQGLDRVIHERARLSILTSLIANKRGLLFGDLKRLCALSDGNLSRHLQVLVEAARQLHPGCSGTSPSISGTASTLTACFVTPTTTTSGGRSV